MGMIGILFSSIFNLIHPLMLAELAILIVISVVSDIVTYKIRNWIVYSFWAIGIVSNFYITGIKGLIISSIGVIVPIGILFILYSIRMIGAGDIKLFSAVGAIMGWKFAIWDIVYSFLVGGVIAIVILVIRKNGKQRIKYLIEYIKSVFLGMKLEGYTDFSDKADGGKFHFSYAIALGTVVGVVDILLTY